MTPEEAVRWLTQKADDHHASTLSYKRYKMAADLIESQAARIAELEREREAWRRAAYDTLDRVNQLWGALSVLTTKQASPAPPQPSAERG